MTIRVPLKAVAIAVYTLALLAGAFGISYAVFEWRDDDQSNNLDPTEIEHRIADLEEQVGSTPTGYQQRLTATEAAALVRSWLFGDGGMAGISPLSGEFIDVRCQGKEFNESSKEWIVSCDLVDGSGSVFDVETYSLNDATGEIQQVS